MKYTVEVALGGTIHIRCFTEIGSTVRKLFGRGVLHRQQGDIISLLQLFKNKQSRTKIWKPYQNLARRLISK